jgi:hypothetical protein
MMYIPKKINALSILFKSKPILFLVFTFCLIDAGIAATRISTSSGGNWNSKSTWIEGIVPLAGDDVIIATTGTGFVRIEGLIACANLTIKSNARLKIMGTNTLNISGNVTMLKPGSGHNSELDVNQGTLNVMGLFNMLASKGTGNADLSISSGTANLTDLNTRGIASRIIFKGNGVLNLSGNLSGSNPSLEPGVGSINLTGSTSVKIWALSYHNLGIAGKGTKTLAENTTVNGTANIEGELNLSKYELILRGPGSPLLISGTLSTVHGLVVYAGDEEQTIAPISYSHLVLKGSGTKILSKGTSVSVSQDLIVDSPTLLESDSKIEIARDMKGAGTLEMESGLLTIGGSNLRTGEFIPGSGTVQYSRDGDQTIRPVDYYNLILAESGEKTIADADQIIINNDLDVNTPLTIPGQLSVNVKGNLTGKGAITLEDATFSLEGTWLNEGVFVPGTSTVIYDGVGDQIIAGNEYYNLETAEGGIKSLAEDIIVKNILTIGEDTELFLDDYELKLEGSGKPLVNNGKFSPASSTVKYTNASETEISAVNYHNLDADGGPRKLSESGIIGISGTFRPGNGKYTTINSTVSFNGVNQTIPQFTFYNVMLTGGGIKRIDSVINVKKLTLKNGSKLDVNSNNGAKIVVVE